MQCIPTIKKPSQYWAAFLFRIATVAFSSSYTSMMYILLQTVTINHAIMAGGAQMKTGQRHKLTEKSSCDSQITMLY